MRAVIVAPTAPDLAALPAEVQTVANTLSSAGHTVHLVTGDDATMAGLVRALDAGPFDLAWLGCHGGAAGFQLSGGATVTGLQLAQWLVMTQAGDVVLNACYSFEHVVALQRYANVNVVAALDAVQDADAWQMAAYLAKAYVQVSGDLELATRIATGNGAANYRYFPAVGVGSMAGTQTPTPAQNDELRAQVEQLVRALRGDPFTGAGGLMDLVADLDKDLENYIHKDEQWKRSIETRLVRLETTRVNFSIWTLLAMATIIAACAATVAWAVTH